MTGWSLRSAESSVFQLSLERGLGAQRRPSGQPRQREPAFARCAKVLILPDGQITSDFQKSCQAPKSKIFLFSLDPNQFTDSRHPVPKEGRAHVTNAGRDAVDAAARETSAACWRTAKSCRSGAPMLASSLREEAQATVSNKPGHRGEREVSRKTIARRMPGDFRGHRGDYARVLFY